MATLDQQRVCISMEQVLVSDGPCSWSRTTRNCKFASIRVLEVQYYDMTLALLTDVPGLAVWLSRRGCHQRRRRQSRSQSSLSPRRTFNMWVDLDAACTARLYSTAGSIAIVMKCSGEMLYTFKHCVLGCCWCLMGDRLVFPISTGCLRSGVFKYSLE